MRHFFLNFKQMHVCRELVTKSADVNGLLNKSGNITRNSGILCEKLLCSTKAEISNKTVLNCNAMHCVEFFTFGGNESICAI